MSIAAGSLSRPMLARRQLRLAVLQALGNKSLGLTILSPGDWNVPPEKLPAVQVRCASETKVSQGRQGPPEFTTTVTLEIEGKVQGITDADAQSALEQLGWQIEETLLKDALLTRLVQQFSSITTVSEIKSDGKVHFGGIKTSFSCETFEAFDSTVAPPDDAPWPIQLDDTVALTSIGLHLDTVQPADAGGTYTGTLFPGAVTPAPRTGGPDGRDEGALDISLPQ